MKRIAVSIVVILAPLLASAQVAWRQTSASISFTIKNRGSDVTGTFGGVKTTILFSPDKPSSSSLKGSLEVGTINTGSTKRDKDLKEEKYFDEGIHKIIEMASTKIVKNGAGYIGTFNISIKGVSKQVEVPFTFTEQGDAATFKGSFTINRRDFGVGTKGGLAMFMADDVRVSVEIKAKK